MLILTSRFILPIYLIPILYYLLKFIFIFTVMLALFMMICSSASAFKVQQNSSKSRFKYEEMKSYAKQGAHYTNTWVSFIEGGSYVVQKIAERHGYVILNEVSQKYDVLIHTTRQT